jgi:hypothetical protein
MSIIEYKINSNNMKLIKFVVALCCSYHLSKIDLSNASISRITAMCGEEEGFYKDFL